MSRANPSLPSPRLRHLARALRPWLPVLAACLCLALYSWKPGSRAPEIAFSLRDKLDHFSVYFLLGILTAKALPTQLRGMPRWLVAFALVSAFGLSDEIAQHFNPARTGDPLDWLADSVGALLGAFAYIRSAAFQRLVDWSPIRCFKRQL
ncbi:VanZ family protein [Pelagicoccus sp. SDUM812003]|uniref:VanZ family protein n=1 Tax=Pelagicoccus sp. SDUM812003 TaxID=3041267 RepID=UPI00280E5196|nr:VanZ family protein [Pelagicoccus sp. SDUM812003]MDQ8203538.1 VanZ family protein [Pelagicoccus sp. SDUM812003]